MKLFTLTLTAAALTAQIPINLDLTPRLGTTVRVALMGDSYAAGEGSPNLTGDRWNSNPCHRSNENGRSAALRRLQADIAGSLNISLNRLQFIDTACSGASINGSIIGENYRGVTPLTRTGPGPVAAPIPSQVTQVKNWLNGAALDVLVLSVGGNDVGFGNVVVKCMSPFTTCKDDAELTTLINRGKQGSTELVGFDFLAGAYQTMKNRIDQDLKPKQVFVTGYPNPLRDENGKFCDRFNDGMGILPTNFADPLNSPYTVFLGLPIGTVSSIEFDKDEAEWVETNLLNRLNTRISQIVAGFGTPTWKFIDVQFMTKLHGFCSNDPWFNTFADSLAIQNDFNGVAHPNREGYKVYDAFVYRTLVRHLGTRVRTQPRMDHENFDIAYTLFGDSKVVRPNDFNLSAERVLVGDNWSIKFRTLVFPSADRIESLTLQVSSRPFDEAIAADIRNFTMDVISQQTGHFDRNVTTSRYATTTTLHVRWRAITRPHWDAAGTAVTRFSPVMRVRIKDGLDSAKKL